MSRPRIPDLPGRPELLLRADANLNDWLQARTQGIGGSEIAALLGVSPYATAFDVYKSKVDDDGQLRFLHDEPVVGPKVRPELMTDEPVLEWGHRLEDAVALKAADELGLVARTGGGLWRHRDHPVAIVTPDRIATKRRSWKPVGLIECKTTSDREEWDDGRAPVHYEVQAQWQLGITGLERCWLACLVLGHERDFRLVEITADPDWFGEMVNVAETFWSKHVLGDEPPMHDLAHPRTDDLVKELHPRAVVEATELPDEAAEWLADYHEAKAEADRAERKLSEIKNWIRLQVGDAGAGYLGEHKVVSYPEVTTTRVDVNKLRENYPEAAEACSVQSTHRRLTVRRLPKAAK